MALYLHLYFGLKAAFEFNGKAILEYGDPLDQPADHPFVVICITALCFQIFQFLLRGYDLALPGIVLVLCYGAICKSGFHLILYGFELLQFFLCLTDRFFQELLLLRKAVLYYWDPASGAFPRPLAGTAYF